MKTLGDINTLLSEFHKKHGIDLHGAKQGSSEWHAARLGLITGSNLHKLMGKPGNETRKTYMAELVAQVCTGIAADEIRSEAIKWGNDHEDAARSSYEFATGEIVEEVPFVFMDEKFREGFSPDGLLSVPKGLELKCPFNSVHYVKFVTEETIKPEYKFQVHHAMRVTGAEEWDFGQFDPRMKVKPLHYVTIERDEKIQSLIAEAVQEFTHDMDKMLEMLGVRFGDQWLRISEKVKIA